MGAPRISRGHRGTAGIGSCWRQDLNLGTPTRTDLESVAFGQTLLRQREPPDRGGLFLGIVRKMGNGPTGSRPVELLAVLSVFLGQLVHRNPDRETGIAGNQRPARVPRPGLTEDEPVGPSAAQARPDLPTGPKAGPGGRAFAEVREASTTEPCALLGGDPNVVPRPDTTSETDVAAGDVDRAAFSGLVRFLEQAVDPAAGDGHHHRGSEPATPAASPLGIGPAPPVGRAGTAAGSRGREVAHTGHATAEREITVLQEGQRLARPSWPGGTGSPSAGGGGGLATSGGGGKYGEGPAPWSGAEGGGTVGWVRYTIGGAFPSVGGGGGGGGGSVTAVWGGGANGDAANGALGEGSITWVRRHFGQKNAPSSRVVPQWMHAGTASRGTGRL